MDLKRACLQGARLRPNRRYHGGSQDQGKGNGRSSKEGLDLNLKKVKVPAWVGLVSLCLPNGRCNCCRTKRLRHLHQVGQRSRHLEGLISII